MCFVGLFLFLKEEIMNVEYKVHVSEIGWMGRTFKNNEVAGTTGEHKGIEAFSVNLVDVPEGVNLGVAYTAHIQDLGWCSQDYTNGEICGTTGQCKHIEAVRMYLFGNDADKYHIYYRCHLAEKGWLNWSSEGNNNGSEGCGLQIEAIQIYVTDDASYRPTNYVDTTQPFVKEEPKPQNKPPSILDVARSYLGYVSGTSEDSIFGRRLVGANAGDYCCYFVVCCAQDAGLEIMNTGYCPYIYDWSKETGRFTGSPQPGDLVLFDFNSNGIPDHIGIVEEVISSDHVRTIEANTGDPIGVYRKDRDFGILGYIRLK